jgi:hypothetical protein
MRPSNPTFSINYLLLLRSRGYRLQVLTRIPAILTGVSRDFPQYLQPTAGIVDLIRPLSLSSLFSIHYPLIPLESRNSSVSVVNGFGLDEWGIKVRFPAVWGTFPSPSRSDRLSGPPSYLMGTGALSPEVKWTGRDQSVLWVVPQLLHTSS